MKTTFALLVCVLEISLSPALLAELSPDARSGRFHHGVGENPHYHSFVIPLGGQKGVPDIITMPETYYHINGTNNTTQVAATTNRIPYDTVPVSFGSLMGGSPLYVGQEYHFGAFAGQPVMGTRTNGLRIQIYDKSTFTPVTNLQMTLPLVNVTNEWHQFLTNGQTKMLEGYGLTTTYYRNASYAWGAEAHGTFVLSHVANSSATNYFYVVCAQGSTDKGNMTLTNDTVDMGSAWTPLYTLDFDERPAWRSVFIDQPHFEGEPLPSSYQGKSLTDLLSISATVTNTVDVQATNWLALDNSPELRTHPILDRFVADMGSNALALANYVYNEIELTDAMAYDDDGFPQKKAINLGGVSRNALGTFMEKQGSPTEQCALLVYLLRQAGVPAAYIFGPDGGLKMLDTQLSKLLKMQIKGVVDYRGKVYEGNLAFGKTNVSQSSTFTTVDLGAAVASRAVDGNLSGNWLNDFSVASTSNNITAWWQIDLGTTNAIGNIEIWNRTEASPSRLSNFYVFVSDANFSSTNLATTLAQSGVSNYYTASLSSDHVVIPVNRSGRYVRVQLAGTNFLSLAEVRILQPESPLITVDYPWVAAYVSNQWVHLFPWLKDREVIEGLNLYDYMPTDYNTGYKWVERYLLADTNILSLSSESDLPSDLFPKFIENVLLTNAPGISIDDIGTQVRNRRNLYAQWSSFPKPFWVTNGAVNTVQNLTTVTNVYPSWTNIFNTVKVEVFADDAPTKKINTGTLRIMDLHNRKFLLRHETNGANYNLIMSLAPFRPGPTNQITAFTNDLALTNLQSNQITLHATTNDFLTVRVTYNRHRTLPGSVSTNFDDHYIGFYEETTLEKDHPLRKGDLAALCLEVGRTTKEMVAVHAEEYWQLQRDVLADPSLTNFISPEIYQGTLPFLMGMAYYERLGRFQEFNERIHKRTVLSQFGSGLSLLAAYRTNNVLVRPLDLVQPHVDISMVECATAGNGTLRPDLGDDFAHVLSDFIPLYITEISAQEHATLQTFYGQNGAISTVSLLRQAQQAGQPGILTLTTNNYTNYPALPGYDQAMWKSVTNTLKSKFGSFATVFITAAPVTNTTAAYRGMGAMVIAPSSALALISVNGYIINGGWSAMLSYPIYSRPSISFNNLSINSFGNWGVSYSRPTVATPSPMSSITPSWNIGSTVSGLSSGIFSLPSGNTTQSQQFNIASVSLGLSSSSVYSSVANLGGSYQPSVGLSHVQTGGSVFDPVNAITGEFYVDATDISLPGPMPLVIRRSYSSHNLDLEETRFGYGWRMAYQPYLRLTDTNLIYGAEMDGTVVAYRQTGEGIPLWRPLAADNPSLNNNNPSGVGSRANLFNNWITNLVEPGQTNYYLYGADGSLRRFRLQSFPLPESVGDLERTRPYLEEWQDAQGNSYTFTFNTDDTKPEYGQLHRVQSSNGGFLVFNYDVYRHIVEAYTGDGRRLRYDYDDYGDLRKVTLPDASEIEYEYVHSTYVTNGTTNVYSTHLLSREIKPDGRVLVNNYDTTLRRVTNQAATVGMDLNLVTNCTFIYLNNFTNITNTVISGTNYIVDVFGNTNTYVFTSNLLTRITDPLNQSVTQDWFVNSTDTGYFPRSLKSATDKRGLRTDLLYDVKGNLTNLTTIGDLTGDGATNQAVTSFSYNANNLLLETVDPATNKVSYVYSATYPFLAEQVIRSVGSTPVSTNFCSYYNVTNLIVVGGVTTTNKAFGLKQREIRAHNSGDAATNEWLHDGRGFVIYQTNYTGTSDPNVVTYFAYNDRGELIQKTDAANRSTVFDYDGRGNLKWNVNYDETNGLKAWELNYYNENGELTWSDGPRYNPEDYVWRDYDGAGRQIQEIRWRSRSIADGSGVEAEADDNLYATTFSEYDAFNNLTKVTDARHNYTLMDYDANGQMIRKRWFDGGTGLAVKTNRFAYEAGGEVSITTNGLGGITKMFYTSTGKLKRQENADGSTNQWRFYLDGRLYREILPSDAYWETTYDDVNRRATRTLYNAGIGAVETREFDRRGNLIKTIDADNFAFTNVYDGLDRIKFAAGPPTSTGGISEQQSTTYIYDHAGVTLETRNGLNERTITTFDSLQRPLTVEIRDGSSNLVRKTSTSYSSDHNSVTVTEGTSNAVVTTTFTDTFNLPVLTQRFPTNGVMEYSRQSYDALGNLAGIANQESATVATETLEYSHDALNRQVQQLRNQSELVTFKYNAEGGLTNRAIPSVVGSFLTSSWVATYDQANRLLTERYANQRGFTNEYYSNGTNAGLLYRTTDPRNVVHTRIYDGLGRPASVTATGTAEQNVSTVFQYDNHGRVTWLGQSVSNSLPTAVQRTYDGYGQITDEKIYINNLLHREVSQKWNAAGRRTQMVGAPEFAQGAGAGRTNTYGYRADGLMTSLNPGGAGYAYNYGDNGLLISKSNPWRTNTVTSRDGMGRIQQMTTSLPGTSLSETLAYQQHSRLTNYIAVRPDFTDTRWFGYNGPKINRLVTEQLVLGASQPVSELNYDYDLGNDGGLGVMTYAHLFNGPSTNVWQSSLIELYGTVRRETSTLAVRFAAGNATNAGAVKVTLDGKEIKNVAFDPASTDFKWRTRLDLINTNTHSLVASSLHPSGSVTGNVTNSLPVSALDTYTNVLDAAWNLTQRTQKKSSGTTINTQTLTWDGAGRLVKVSERDDVNDGFDFVSVYDGFGRRLRTVYTPVFGNVAMSNILVTTESWFDPQVEFLEIAVTVNGQRTWKIYGPDVSGIYGGMEGVGGLEATIREMDGASTGILNDYFGNAIGTISGSVTMNPARYAGYGPVPGYPQPFLDTRATIAEAVGWRGQRVDPTDFINLGMRPYNPHTGSFISPDPLGHEGSMDLKSYANGDPINRGDFDGRLGKQIQKQWDDLQDNLRYQNSFTGSSGGSLLPTVANVATLGLANNISSVFEHQTIHGGFVGPTERNLAKFELGLTVASAVPWGRLASTATRLGESLTAGIPRVGTYLDNSAPRLNPANYQWNFGQVNMGMPTPNYVRPGAKTVTMSSKTIGLGLDLEGDLARTRSAGALTYEGGAWQKAGLTTVDWGRASVDNSWFRMSFREAAKNADAIRFDISNFSPTHPKPGMTTYEFNHILGTPELLPKTTFIQNGETVIWNGSQFVKP